MPLLFPKFSSKGIHKTNEDRNFDHAEVEFDTDKNSRRYFNNKPKKEPIRARGPLLFLLQTWGGGGGLINKSKYVLQVLCVELNSKETSVLLPQENKDKIISQCQDFSKQELLSVWDLRQVFSRF